MVLVVLNHVRRVHPVEWLVGATIGMDSDTTIGLHHHKAQSFWETGL
jgi:predicted metal-dependent TIM-barrel fold hydrolase